MTAATQSLQELHRRLARKRKAALMVEDLRAQLNELEDTVAFLREAYLDEQSEVQRLEGESFSALLLRLLSWQEERRSAGGAELCAAAMKYETAAAQLGGVQAQLAALLREQTQYDGAEAALSAAFLTERQRLSQEEPQRAAELLATEQRIAAAEAELREVEEALIAGTRVLSAVESAARSLSGAEGWHGFDPLSGSPAAAAGALAGQPGQERDRLYTMQELLRCYRTELADVSLEAGLRMKVDGFLHFADGFYDDFFSHAAAWDIILSAEQRLSEVEEQVQAVQEHLSASQEGFLHELERLRALRDTLCSAR